MNIGMGKQLALFVAALTVFAAVGLLAVMPVHAQSTTTSSTSTSNPSTGSTSYPSGHNCPNMGSPSSTTGSSSSSSSSTTAG